MSFSTFDRTGDLVHAFTDRGAALDYLAGIARAAREAAGEAYLIAQGSDGNIVGETVYASPVSVPA